jgi:hypothetical protein
MRARLPPINFTASAVGGFGFFVQSQQNAKNEVQRTKFKVKNRGPTFGKSIDGIGHCF